MNESIHQGEESKEYHIKYHQCVEQNKTTE